MHKSTIKTPARYPDRSLEQALERWWLAKVKPRQEKLMAGDFFAEDIEYYLPLYPKNTPRPGTCHPRIFHVPLFPGYIAFAQEKPHNIYRSGRVVNMIEIRNQKRFIREMNQIYFLLDGDAPLEPVISGAFKVGTPVEILHGPFKGVTGIVESSKASPTTLVLSVEGLGRASLKIDSSWLKEID